MNRKLAAGVGFLFVVILGGCAGTRETGYSLKASQQFARANEVRFTDLRPSHREELVLRKKHVLQILTNAVKGAELVPDSTGPVVGKIEVLDEGKVLAEYRYHLGGTLETISGHDRISFKPLPEFHPALFIGGRRDWLPGS